MTDDKAKDEDGEAGTDEPTPAAEADAEPEIPAAGGEIPPPEDERPPDDGQADSRQASRWPLPVALVAFLMALIAASASAWLWISERGPDDLTEANQASLRELRDTLEEARRTLRETEQALSALENRDSDLSGSIDTLRRSLDEQLRPLESVPGRLSGLEASMAALQGISSGVRDTWLLAEAEYYMEIANAQLQLAANPTLAEIALKLADERIAKIASPRLTDVRRALSDELRALDALEAPDIEGAALTLASLAGTVETLPLANDVVPPGQREVDVDEELSGVDRALASLRNAMSDVVSVRRTDQPVRPLLPPDAAYFLRSNLTLQLQAARLALLRGEKALYEQSLDDAARWLDEYFDAGQKSVSSALETIEELRESQTTMERIDISRSLTLLRRYLALEAEDREAGPQQ